MCDKYNRKTRMYKRNFRLFSTCILISIIFLGSFILSKNKHAEAAKRIIVTIDPGHGGSEKGAYVRYKGRLVCEKNLNLKIAKYMKQELEAFKNVTVYLTRSYDRTLTLADRVQIAKRNHSDFFFSIHNNACGYSYDNGACALISSGLYHKELSTVAAAIGHEALERISSSTGIINRGYLKRLSEISTYPNKKPADYYAIVRGGTNAGIASMILEHGFVDNKKELKKLLKKSVQKKLGQADARAIAHYYGLSKKNGTIKYKRLGSDIKMTSRHWMLKDGRYYFVTNKERILTGWRKINNQTYHFHSVTGAATKGFHQIGSNYYYFDNHGKAFHGWKKIHKKWYYFRTNGKAFKNCTKKIKGKMYRFGKKGICRNH